MKQGNFPIAIIPKLEFEAMKIGPIKAIFPKLKRAAIEGGIILQHKDVALCLRTWIDSKGNFCQQNFWREDWIR